MSERAYEEVEVAWQASRSIVVPIPCLVGRLALSRPDIPRALVCSGFGESIPSLAAALNVMEGCGLATIATMLNYASLPKEIPFQELAIGAPIAIARALGNGRSMDMVGASLGGPSALLASGYTLEASHVDSELFGAIATLNAAGLTNGCLGASALIRELRLGWRLGVRTAWQNLGEPAARPVGVEAFRELRQLAGAGRLREAANYITSPYLAQQLVDHLKALLKAKRSVRLFVSTEESCFRPRELAITLGRAAREMGLRSADLDQFVENVRGPHSSLNSVMGIRQLGRVGKWLASTHLRPKDLAA